MRLKSLFERIPMHYRELAQISDPQLIQKYFEDIDRKFDWIEQEFGYKRFPYKRKTNLIKAATEDYGIAMSVQYKKALKNPKYTAELEDEEISYKTNFKPSSPVKKFDLTSDFVRKSKSQLQADA